MKDVEIEKRYFTNDKKALLLQLKNSGPLIYKKHQIDTYFVPKHRNFLAEKYPFEWLRLRDDGKDQSITYKHWYPERVPESTHCDEFESGLENGEAVKKILDALDFTEIVVVDKTRTAYRIEDFEVSVDDVKDLGTFVEVEIKGDFDSVSVAVKEIEKFAKDLSLIELPEDHPVRTGYPLPLYRKLKGV